MAENVAPLAYRDDHLVALLGRRAGPGEGSAPRRLLRTAVDLFAERGFQATTTRDICRRAGAGEAAVYDHFSSKEEMLYLVVEAAHVDGLRRLEEARAGGASPDDRLAALTEAFVSFHAEWPTATSVANLELRSLAPGHRKEIESLRARIEDLFRRALRRGLDEGAFDVPDVATAVFAILSIGIGVSRWFRPGRRLSPAEVGQLHAELVLRMVGRRR